MGRPARRMPTWAQVIRHHGLNKSNPACWKCRQPAMAWCELERAHVIDRVLDGLDGPQNIRPLCSNCHRYQPAFEPSDTESALAWFADHRSALAVLVSELIAEYRLETR